MTTATISFREFLRGQMPADVLFLTDKRSGKAKGVYINEEYADKILEILKKMENEAKVKRKKALMDFVGEFGSGSEYQDMSLSQITEDKYE